MGYLAELFRFPGWASADELLLLHQRLAGSSGGEAERAELLELVGLTEARSRRVENMSKGMQQRLGIAQALVGTPRFLFLDEPTSALDPGGRRTVRGLLEELRRRGVAVLLNSHLLSEIELVCDRVVILSRGKTVAEGRPADLARARGVEVDVDGEDPASSRAPSGRTCPGSSPTWSPPGSASTASGCSRRPSRRSTSRRSGTTRDDRGRRRSSATP